MNRFALLLLALPAICYGQANIFDNLSWSAKGSHANQSLGASGLDYIGYVNDTIQHAFALGEDGGSSYVFNRKAGDTTRQFKFPGHKVFRANFDGNLYPDFLCWDGAQIKMLLGTAKIDSFHVVELHGDVNKDDFRYLDGRICVIDANVDGYDDVLVDEMSHDTPRFIMFKGGLIPDSTVSVAKDGNLGEWYYGALLQSGRVKDTSQQFLLSMRFTGPEVKLGTADSAEIYRFKLGSQFNLIPDDTVYCTLDTPRYCCMNYTDFVVMDIDNDGIDDLCFAGYDNTYKPSLMVDPTVFVYKGGATISPLPTYFFHRPHQTNSSEFGSKIADLGNLTGRGYHTIAITDPDASDGGDENGAVFLYNIGRALKDSCVAYGVGPQQYMDKFGTNIISLGDSEFAVGADADSIAIGAFDHGGRIFVFHGSSSYGPIVSVNEQATLPNQVILAQNYPNPFSISTTLAFLLQNSGEAHAVLSVYDMIGREIARIYDGPTNQAPRTARFSAKSLQAGNYVVRLTAGGRTTERIMQIVK